MNESVYVTSQHIEVSLSRPQSSSQHTKVPCLDYGAIVSTGGARLQRSGQHRGNILSRP